MEKAEERDRITKGYRYWLTQNILARYELTEIDPKYRVTEAEMKKYSVNALKSLWVCVVNRGKAGGR
jgi:hypothetical protein